MAHDECIDINKTIQIYRVYRKNVEYHNMWFIENETLLTSE